MMETEADSAVQEFRQKRKNRDLQNVRGVREVRQYIREYQGLDDLELRSKSLELAYEAKCGTKLRRLATRAFAVVSEAIRRVKQIEPFDVQFFAGLQLARERIVEMQTGEGKTLTATLPSYLFSLYGKGVHVATVNDYLAKRDRDYVAPIFELLGISVACIRADDPPEHRREAYLANITYATSKEFGFDFLRDQIAIRQAKDSESKDAATVQRGLHYVLVDEADSILIDEARTPLIIGMIDQASQNTENDCFRWAAKHAGEFDSEKDYRLDEKTSQIHLRPQGIQKLRQLPQTNGTREVGLRELYRHMETAIKVRRDFKKDRNYAVRFDPEEEMDKVVIIDEFTGRIAEGRQWQQGIHQAVEAKENLEITPATRHAARVTVQELFALYRHFAGMTGTAWTSRREFRKAYKKKVTRIPTNRPSKRKQLPDRVFDSQQAKFQAIALVAKRMVDSGRAVLIGTRSVAKSEELSEMLDANGVVHSVLNAKHLEQEAEIVAQAGQPKKVTIATNMAGRGTDIKVDANVESAGGLHVILSEVHESQRIDRQLIGRCGRQGDNGTYQVMVSFDDDLLKSGFGVKKGEGLQKRFLGKNELPANLESLFRKAQRKVERKHLVDRMILVRQNKERLKRQWEMGLDPYLDLPE